MNETRRTWLGRLTALGMAATPIARAQNAILSSRTVRIVHGYDGGLPDVVARLIAPGMAAALGTSLVVEPRPGASERIAALSIASAPPDGHSLYMMTGALPVVAATDPSFRLDLLRDFSYVATVARTPLVITVAGTSPLHSIDDLCDAARRAPGRVNYATGGVGTTAHLTMELLARQCGISLAHIPYKGATIQATDLLGGSIDMAVTTLTAMQGLLTAGKLRALAITSLQRHPRFSEVATVAETLSGFDVETWLALAGPARLTPSITTQLTDAVRTAMGEPQVGIAIEATGSARAFEPSEQTRLRVSASLAHWRPLAALARNT